MEHRHVCWPTCRQFKSCIFSDSASAIRVQVCHVFVSLFFEVLGVQRVCCVRVGHVALDRRSIWFGWAAGRVFPSVCHRHRFMRTLLTITKVCVRVCCVSLAHLVLDCGEKYMV